MAGNKNSQSCSNNEDQALPRLSASEFRTYNRMSEQMDAFVSVP